MTADGQRLSDLDTVRAMPQVLDRGRWAVACVGMQGWRQHMAIGDGITAALCALRTRCETREEADDLARQWNDAQPGVLPGSRSVFVYEARPYRKLDYIGSQNIGRGQTRDCGHRIA